jgi:hypothetical protein
MVISRPFWDSLDVTDLLLAAVIGVAAVQPPPAPAANKKARSRTLFNSAAVFILVMNRAAGVSAAAI